MHEFLSHFRPMVKVNDTWVRTTERLPDIKAEYLGVIEGYLAGARYIERVWYDPETQCFYTPELEPIKVSEWMPMPELPRELSGNPG